MMCAARALQASRAFQPRPVREVIEHRAADRLAKQAKDREKDSEKDIAESTVLREVSHCLVEYGRIVERRIDTYIVNPDQERREAEKQSLENLEALDLSDDVKVRKSYMLVLPPLVPCRSVHPWAGMRLARRPGCIDIASCLAVEEQSAVY